MQVVAGVPQVEVEVQEEEHQEEIVQILHQLMVMEV